MSWLKRLIGIREPYWKLIDPYWKSVEVTDDKTFLLSFRSLPPPVQRLYAAELCQWEINNGGFEQFLTNYSGAIAPESVEGFSALGMPRMAAAMATLVAGFGADYPRDTGRRRAVLAAIADEYEARADAMGEEPADETVSILLKFSNTEAWDILRSESGGFVAAANRYVEAHT